MSLNLFHIPYARLVDWVDGRLANDQQAALIAHLAACPRCRTEAAHIERMLATMQTDSSQDAPTAVIARAVQLFRAHAAAPAPSLVQRLTAALRFESSPLTPAFGLRGERATERQLLFSAGDYDVDLRIAPSPTGWQVSGQVLGEVVGTGVAHLAGVEVEWHAAIDPVSTFVLPSAPAGHYTLTLTWPTLAIVIDDLGLGPV